VQYALGEDTVGGGGRVCACEETVRDVLRLLDGGLVSHENGEVDFVIQIFITKSQDDLTLRNRACLGAIDPHSGSSSGRPRLVLNDLRVQLNNIQLVPLLLNSTTL